MSEEYPIIPISPKPATYADFVRLWAKRHIKLYGIDFVLYDEPTLNLCGKCFATIPIKDAACPNGCAFQDLEATQPLRSIETAIDPSWLTAPKLKQPSGKVEYGYGPDKWVRVPPSLIRTGVDIGAPDGDTTVVTKRVVEGKNSKILFGGVELMSDLLPVQPGDKLTYGELKFRIPMPRTGEAAGDLRTPGLVSWLESNERKTAYCTAHYRLIVGRARSMFPHLMAMKIKAKRAV
jgi:hypothetical protein